MKWLAISIGVLAGAALVLELLRRRADRLHGPHYRQHVDDWYAKEPTIPPLDLPAVKPLKGVVLPKFDRYRRFQDRMGRGGAA